MVTQGSGGRAGGGLDEGQWSGVQWSGGEGRGGEGLCTQQSIHHEVSDASSRTSSYAFTMDSSSIIAMAVNMKVTVNTSEFSQIYLWWRTDASVASRTRLLSRIASWSRDRKFKVANRKFKVANRKFKVAIASSKSRIASSKSRSQVQSRDRKFKVAMASSKSRIASSKSRIASFKSRSQVQSRDRKFEVANRELEKK